MIRSATSLSVWAACAAVLLAGCGAGSGPDRESASDGRAHPRTTVTVTTTPPTTSSTATSWPTPGMPTVAHTGRPTPAAAPTGPTVVSCYLADGTARMSDGSLAYSDRCHESAGHPDFDSAGAKSWVDCVIANGQEYCANRFAPPTARAGEDTRPATSPDPGTPSATGPAATQTGGTGTLTTTP